MAADRRRDGLQGLLMVPAKINPDKIRAFKDAESFHKWLGKHHLKEDEIWIKIHKVDSGFKSITPKQAIDVVLCWGWIDGIRKGFDDQSYLQRYSPRKKTSVWSQINVANVAADRGRPHDRAWSGACRDRQGRRPVGSRLQERQ